MLNAGGVKSASRFAVAFKEELAGLDIDRETIAHFKSIVKGQLHDVQAVLDVIVVIQEELYESSEAKHVAYVYLIDCLIKNFEVYLRLMSPALPSMFGFIWKNLKNVNDRRRVARTIETWRSILPPETMQEVDAISVSAPFQHKHIESHQATASLGPGSLPNQDPYQSAAHMPATAAQGLLQPLQTSPLLLQPLSNQQPQGVVLLPSTTASNTTLPLLLNTSSQAYTSSVQSHNTRLDPLVVLPVVPTLQPVPQPQIVLPASAPPPLPVNNWTTTIPTTLPSTAALSTGDFLSSLASLTQRLGGGPETCHSATPPVQLQNFGKVVGSLTYKPPSILQDVDQAAIDELLDASNQTRSKFLDRKFLRRKRANRASQQTQPWYYPVEQWLLGSKRNDEDATYWMDEEEKAAAAAAAESALNQVEEDPSQPECAISGEPFERWYDPDTDKWYYMGAVILTGVAAALQGVMDGSIVKAACLAGQPNQLAMALKGMAAAKVASVPSSHLGHSSFFVTSVDQTTQPPTSGPHVPCTAFLSDHLSQALLSNGPIIKEEPQDTSIVPSSTCGMNNSATDGAYGARHVSTSHIEAGMQSVSDTPWTHVQQPQLPQSESVGVMGASNYDMASETVLEEQTARYSEKTGSSFKVVENPTLDSQAWDQSSHISDVTMHSEIEEAKSNGLAEELPASNKRIKIEHST
ncbi:hypothetical protein CEUSTIGMA_g9397.t1 [Chlamydomonas eustigma]|uniref:CID domain-containing protein n=1 Tax=Chlamydomonas eustigma TaxID=1157962 RepID=A0A250XGD5_9CHLO|nr:hypothetical protein CEUSTIGMA_g9397.t1 [Chlamydomonas eustigma]|eukprot:GAX81969.1 hypothetical protein CEUSTIGMA_g9397.t1 [Chlamydomonas eustigma]